MRHGGTKDAAREGGRRRLSVMVAVLFLWGIFASPQAVARQLQISGITEAEYDVALGASVTGRVAKIHFKEGDWVTKGKTILELDHQLEELEVERRRLIWQSKVEVESAARQMKTLEAHLEGTRKLYETTGSVNREELENQELEYFLAQAELARLEMVEKREKIECDIAEEQLSKRSLRAPFSGLITELRVKVGENYELDQPLVHLVGINRCYFVCNVELSTIGGLKTWQTVELQLQTEKEPVVRKATIVFISPVVDPASGLRKVKAVFSNNDGKIVPGVTGVMFLQAE